MALNLNQLRVFLAVAEQLSITAAARTLRVSQPAVSKQLAELENSLGTQLVDRLPRGIRLTAPGELLAEHARRIFRAEDAAEGALAQLLGLDGGKLAVGASTTIGNYLVPPVLGEFHAQHPRVSVELEIGNTQAVTRALLEGRLDVGLIEGLYQGEALQQEVLTHDEMVLITSPKQRLPKSVSLERLKRLPLISREQGSGSREVVEAALAEAGVEIAPVMSLGSTEAVKNAVLHGLGIAMVSRLTVQLELQSGRLRQLQVEGLQVRRALHLVTSVGKSLSPAAAQFVKLLREHYR